MLDARIGYTLASGRKERRLREVRLQLMGERPRPHSIVPSEPVGCLLHRSPTAEDRRQGHSGPDPARAVVHDRIREELSLGLAMQAIDRRLVQKYIADLVQAHQAGAMRLD